MTSSRSITISLFKFTLGNLQITCIKEEDFPGRIELMPKSFRTLKPYSVLCIFLVEKLLTSLTKLVVEGLAVFKSTGF